MSDEIKALVDSKWEEYGIGLTIPAKAGIQKPEHEETRHHLLAQLAQSARCVESEEVQPGVVLDFNSENRVVGIEMLNISKRVERENLLDFQFESNFR